jgi:Flp pilus assembly protein CpaB
MRPATANVRRKSMFLTVAWVIAGALGGVVLLAAAGVIEVPFLRKAKAVAAKPPPPPGSVPVILAPRPIPAFTRVTRDHLLDAKTLEFVVMYLPAESVTRGGLLTFEKISGRVLAGDKAAGFAFTDKDFLPPGTRPGMVAGIPPGKRSFVLQSDRITGIQALQIGDRVDVLATLPVDFDKALEKYTRAGVPLFVAEAQEARGSYLPRRAGVKALVQDGAVVAPVKSREVTMPNTAIGPDGKAKTKVVQEVTIAIDPAEVAPLTEALAVNAQIFCVAHSGLPNEPAAQPTPGSNPSPRMSVTETIVGNKRELHIFAAPGAPPKRVPLDDEPTRKEPGPTPAARSD